MEPLGEAESGSWIVRDQPDGGGQNRVEQGGEVDADTTDERSPVLGKAPGQRGVDVLVREVVGRQASNGCEQPSAEAREHDPGQPDPGGHGGRASEGVRRGGKLSIRMRSGEVDGHGMPIGKP